MKYTVDYVDGSTIFVRCVEPEQAEGWDGQQYWIADEDAHGGKRLIDGGELFDTEEAVIAYYTEMMQTKIKFLQEKLETLQQDLANAKMVIT